MTSEELKVYCNGILCAHNKGGYVSFTADITNALHVGDNAILVHARDNQRGHEQPFGKQCEAYQSAACSYTRTTGIWQTVWLEEVPETRLDHARMIPHAADGALEVTVFGVAVRPGMEVRLTAVYEGCLVGTALAHFVGDKASAWLNVSEVHLWNPGTPELYELEIQLMDGTNLIDTVESYFALRDVALTSGLCFLLAIKNPPKVDLVIYLVYLTGG